MMKAWQHFKTITTHKMWVMRYCFKIGLYWQGLTHDLSKYSPTEFLVGMKYYQGDRSPNNAEREDTGMSKSWMHHKGRNKHHFEYWIDYGINCDTIIKGVPMPRRYVAEMIMDRISASRVYLGDAYTDQAPYQYLKKESATSGSSIPRHSRSSNFCCACSRNAAKTIPSITSATTF